MDILKTVIDRNSAGLEALLALQRKLSLDEGAVSEASRKKTREAFGEDLSPIQVVRRIIADVRAQGDDAVRHYTKLLDGVDLAGKPLAVPEADIEAGYTRCDTRLRDALATAADRVRRYQTQTMRTAPADFVDGSLRIRTVLRPIPSAGAYAPGGAARYPSSVLMTVVPATVAGVQDIAVATPPAPGGNVPDSVLAACRISGATRLIRVGGVQAIAALALGTESIPRVDKIVGPGNLFVNLAKKELFGAVGIDLLAGPSEVLILADDSADAALVAADLLSQAEHSPGAAVLVTTSESLASAVAARVEATCPSGRAGDELRRCLDAYGLIVVTDTMARAVELSNRFAVEHLQIMAADADSLLEDIRAAGAVFVRDRTPVAVGDYAAGPSHVLPTGGTARFLSGLSADDFLIRAAAIEVAAPDPALDDVITTVAEAEGLNAHAESIRIRRGPS